MMTARLIAPGLIIFVLAGAVAAGLAATVSPAFGYFPALGGNAPTLAHVEAVLAMPGMVRSIGLAMTSGLAATLISCCLVFLFVAAYAGTPAMDGMRRLIAPILAVPHAALALGLALLVTPSGLILRLLSPEITGFTQPPDWLVINDPAGLALIAALVVKEVPFLLLMVLAGLPQLPIRPARMLMTGLGYGRIAAFLFVLGPPLYRQMRFAVLAVLAYSTSVVDVAMILGPDLPATLPVRISRWMADPDLQMRFPASAGAVVQLLATLACMALWLLLETAVSFTVAALRERGFRLAADAVLRRTALLLLVVLSGMALAGIAVIGLWSVAGLWPFPQDLPSDIGMTTWLKTLPRIATPLQTTLVVALASSVAALLLTIALLWDSSRQGRPVPPLLRALLFAPLVLPQICFVFGLQLLAVMLGADHGLPSLVVVHLIFVLPYTMLSLSGPWAAFDTRLETIARSFGRSPLAILVTIRLPMMLRACTTALAVGFAVSVGLYLPTLLIGAGRLTTITTEAVALASGGDRRVIGVYALLQACLPLAGFVIAAAIPQLLFRRRRAMRI